MSRRAIRSSFVVVLALGIALPSLLGQDETPEENQYREDYERVTKAVAITDPAKKAEALLAFVRERSNSKMEEYAQANYLQILDVLVKAGNNTALLNLAERYIRVRPRVGETYYFQGVALKNMRKFPEAMDSLAKCIVLKNRISGKAREFLEYIYKGQNKGDLTGLDKVIKRAADELGR